MPNSRIYREKHRKKTRYSSDSDSEREKARKYREKSRSKAKDERKSRESSSRARDRRRRRSSSSSSSDSSDSSSSRRTRSSSSSSRDRKPSKSSKSSQRSREPSSTKKNYKLLVDHITKFEINELYKDEDKSKILNEIESDSFKQENFQSKKKILVDLKKSSISVPETLAADNDEKSLMSVILNKEIPDFQPQTQAAKAGTSTVRLPHHSKSRWRDVSKALEESKISGFYQFERVLKSYSETTIKSFQSFRKPPENFFDSLLPKIIRLALKMPELFQSPLPLLQTKMNHSISLSQEQVACILANAFLCTFPTQNQVERGKNYGEINFASLYATAGEKVEQKLRCLVNYFERVCVKSMPSGIITFQRVSIDKLPQLRASDVDLSTTRVDLIAKSVHEEGVGMLKMVSTSEIYGQTVLSSDCYEEIEVPFFLYPELIASILFSENLKKTEAIVVSGCEKFNRHSQIGDKFKWGGDHIDDTPLDTYRRRLSNFVVIGGIEHNEEFHEQFLPDIILRDFRRAYVGFYHNPLDVSPPIPVCSGLQTCPKIQQSKHLKFVLLLLACSYNGRDFRYCTKGEVQFQKEIQSFVNYIEYHKIKAGRLFEILYKFSKHAKECVDRKQLHPHRQLFRFIYKCHFENFLFPKLQLKPVPDNNERPLKC